MTGQGIFGEFGPTTVISGNDLVGPGDHGIAFARPASVRIEGNSIVDRQTGIKGAEGTPTIRDNTIRGSGVSAIVVGSGEPTVADNELTDNNIAMGWSAQTGLMDGNSVSGGTAGIVVGRGSPAITNNTLEGIEGRALAIGARTSPTLSGNTSCGNEVNLYVADNASPEIDETNEICEDASSD